MNIRTYLGVFCVDKTCFLMISAGLVTHTHTRMHTHTHTYNQIKLVRSKDLSHNNKFTSTVIIMSGTYAHTYIKPDGIIDNECSSYVNGGKSVSKNSHLI